VLGLVHLVYEGTHSPCGLYPLVLRVVHYYCYECYVHTDVGLCCALYT